MPFHHTPPEWQERIDAALLGELGEKTLAVDLWKAVTDLKEALQLAEVWRVSAGNWEAQARKLESEAEKTIYDCEEAEAKMRARMQKHDAIIDLVCGRAEPMRSELRENVRQELLSRDPEKVTEVAKRTYEAFRRVYRLKNEWEKESSQRRESLTRTIEIIMEVLAGDTKRFR